MTQPSSFYGPDPMGTAMWDYYHDRCTEKLWVRSSLFDEDEIAVSYLFRQWEEMPPLEQTALEMAAGSILDIGAGAGSHALVLQDMGKQVEAVDISALAVETMRARGVEAVRRADIWREHWGTTYDTLLLLMNGTGLAGRLSAFPTFLQRLKALLRPQGKILVDGSDLRFIFENEDGEIELCEGQEYYGEVDFTMRYGKVVGELFSWLYLDFATLASLSRSAGLEARLMMEGESHDYLACLSLV